MNEKDKTPEELAEENEDFAPPSDEDFLAALGPCGK